MKKLHRSTPSANRDTLAYYNANATNFVAGTSNVNMTDVQQRFLQKLQPASLILDFGCGSGRDTKYFLEKGFRVEATDGSSTIVKLASEYTGIPVKRMRFEELNETNKYDGIWACSSILHLPYKELKKVFYKMAKALKKDGIVYTSFKYGTFEGMRHGRYFIDMTEERCASLLQETDVMEVEDQWITRDGRPDREDEQWLNLILRKK